MLRGFRWQVLALIFAVVLFVAALVARPVPEPAPSLSPTPAPTTVADAPVTATAESSPSDAIPTTVPNTPVVNTITTDPVPTYREGLVGDVRRLNPLLRGLNQPEDDINALIYEGLVQINEYGEPEPALAADWVIASNRIEYVFTLREDVRWHDGTPFTAQDVAFTMSLLRSPEFPGDPALYEFWRTVETQVLDDYTVRFRLTQPLASFLDALQVGILPRHALDGISAAQLVDHPFNLSPIGTGPYQREAIRTTNGSNVTTVDLRPSPVYAQRSDTPDDYSIERVRFQIYPTLEAAIDAFRAGEIDGVAAADRTQRQSLLGLPDAEIYTKLEPALGVLIFNWRVSEDDVNPFREQRVREALTRALNRDAIIQRNFTNVAVTAHNPLMPGLWAYASEIAVPGYSPDEARALLDSAGLLATPNPDAPSDDENAEDTTGDNFQVDLLVPDDPALVGAAEEITSQWSQIGLSASVETVDEETYQARLDSGDFDTAIVELGFGRSADPDVYAFWHEGQYPDGENISAVDDRGVSETLERARRDPFGINRVQHYRDFQQEFVQESIAIPLYYPLFTYVVSERVDGVQLGFVGNASDRFRNIHEWQINDAG